MQIKVYLGEFFNQNPNAYTFESFLRPIENVESVMVCFGFIKLGLPYRK